MAANYLRSDWAGVHTETWFRRKLAEGTEEEQSLARQTLQKYDLLASLTGSRATTVNETHTGIRAEDNVTRDIDQFGTTTTVRPGGETVTATGPGSIVVPSPGDDPGSAVADAPMAETMGMGEEPSEIGDVSGMTAGLADRATGGMKDAIVVLVAIGAALWALSEVLR